MAPFHFPRIGPLAQIALVGELQDEPKPTSIAATLAITLVSVVSISFLVFAALGLALWLVVYFLLYD